MSRIVNIQVRCEQCASMHDINSPELDDWHLDVKIGFASKEYLGDYCPRCFDELQHHFAALRPTGQPKPPRPRKPARSEPVVHVCPECKTFTSGTAQGLSVHRRRAHGVVGLHAPSRGKRKQPTRRVAGTLGGGA